MSVCACACVGVRVSLCVYVYLCVCSLLQVEDPRSSLLRPHLSPLSSLTPLLPSLESLVKGSRIDDCVCVQEKEGEREGEEEGAREREREGERGRGRAVEEENVYLCPSQCTEGEDDEVGLYMY